MPRTEEELNRPEPQTLWMLGVVCVATVVMWGAARAACNYHPPHESRRARVTSLAELTVDPKNAAIEGLQRWATRNYAGALEVATGPARAQIEAEQSACAQAGPSCLAEAKALKDKVLTTAELLDMGPGRALVRVFTHGAKPARSLVEVVREGAGWKVNQRKVDDGQGIPAAASVASDAPGAAGAAAH